MQRYNGTDYSATHGTDSALSSHDAKKFVLNKYNPKEIKQVDGGTQYILSDYVYVSFSETVKQANGKTDYYTAISFTDKSKIADDFYKGLLEMMYGN